MYRKSVEYLTQWSQRDSRKPLVIRGARQVGKSYLVKLFAKSEGLRCVEINFDSDPQKSSFFSSNNPLEIVQNIELSEDVTIDLTSTLLFLDEVQATPEVLASLRYFYEKMPQLRIIAAGSLLEFALEEHSFSMPVGRIEYLHLGPMQFDEFLVAMDKEKLLNYIKAFSIGDSIAEPIHSKLLNLFKIFLITGGMPEAIRVYCETSSFEELDRVKSSIISTYRDDFSKYKKRINITRLQKVFTALPGTVAEKIKYVKLDREERAKDIEATLHLFELAQIIYRVSHISSNGVPLAAEENRSSQKLIFLDVGLFSQALGLSLLTFQGVDETVLINSGAVCEQFVAQHLLYRKQYYIKPELHYWVREKKGASSEVDFVISQENRVIPVEVKAGKTGRLRSLQVFVEEKKSPISVRFNTDVPSLLKSETISQKSPFALLSLPFYLITELSRLIDEC